MPVEDAEATGGWTNMVQSSENKRDSNVLDIADGGGDDDDELALVAAAVVGKANPPASEAPSCSWRHTAIRRVIVEILVEILVEVVVVVEEEDCWSSS